MLITARKQEHNQAVRRYQLRGVPEPGKGRELFTARDAIDLWNRNPKFREAIGSMERAEGHQKCITAIMNPKRADAEGIRQQMKENATAQKIARQKADGTFDDWEKAVGHPMKEADDKRKYDEKRYSEPKYRKVYPV